MDWQPIETAPKDGTRILITDGKLLTVAEWWYWEEPPTTSLGVGDPETRIPAGGFSTTRRPWSIEKVPNPKAGQRYYSWLQDNPIAFIRDDVVGPDYDGHFDNIDPTHWMPLPEPPAIADTHPKGQDAEERLGS